MRKRLHKLKSKAARAGFTLVEMLVATALVLLIMLLFASIYGAAVGTITEQRGLANVDSKARTVDSIIRRDLEKMTFRQLTTAGTKGIVPLAPGDEVDPRQLGFLYISENDPNDPTDDTIHFTIYVGSNHRNPDNTPLTGKASSMGGLANEPDRDDGVAGNVAGMSPYAEVVYFLRGGNLYRRELLIRDPLDSPLNTPDYPSQPWTSNYPRTERWGPDNPDYPADPNNYDSTVNYYSGSGNSFYNDFDYAATRVPDGSGSGNYLRFLGPESLNNAAGLSVYPLAAPRYRFGFIPTAVNAPGNMLGTPVEYDLASPTRNYIGSFVQAETSHDDFVYPGRLTGPADFPTSQSGMEFQLDGDFLLDKFNASSSTTTPGPRQGADLLLQEVSQFNIEVWDTNYIEVDQMGDGFDLSDDLNGNGVQDQGAWVDLGHDESNSGTTGLNLGYYHINNRSNNTFGPGGPFGNRVFDTWHPDIGVQPPFRPYNSRPPAMPPVWGAAAVVNVGQTIYPDFIDDGNPNNDNYAFAYRCIEIGRSPTTPPGSVSTSFKEPEWPRQHGAIVRENANTGQEVVWQCFDNRVGLETIRITIRYRDIRSKIERQLTLYHSFVE